MSVIGSKPVTIFVLNYGHGKGIEYLSGEAGKEYFQDEREEENDSI